MAGMRLDLRDEALKPTKSGAVPIVPGDPDNSAIIQRIFSTSKAKLMPPVYAHKELSDGQKQIIKRWVAEGAKYEGHWAYAAVARPMAPEEEISPIDAFIRERLKAEGLSPAPEADKRTLIRRVSFDLIGLPPTPEEAQAFVNDTSSDAYEKVVDRLLSSPRYAEQQAMRWLDAVRFADTCGFHGDNALPAWPYRDYILKSFLENKPFDQFTREQLAGDLLPNATLEQRVASAYNRMNRTSAEGGLQPKEYLAKYGADRVRTLSTVWMGATMGCSECHDHKFDPFLARDFYSMKAFFADIEETGLVPDRGSDAWGTKLALPDADQAARLKRLDEEIAQATSELHRQVVARPDWERRVLAQYDAGQLAWKFQLPMSAVSAQGATLTVARDEPIDQNFYVGGSLTSERKPSPGLIVASGKNPDNDTYTVQFKPGAGVWTALGIEVQQDESLPGNRLGRGADRFELSEVEAEMGARKLPFVLATSEKFGEMDENVAMTAIDGDPATGWAVSFGESRNPFLALRFGEKVQTTADSVITARLYQNAVLRRATIGRFRLALSSGEYSWPQRGDAAAKGKVNYNPSVSILTVDLEYGLPARVRRALKTPADERDDDQQKAVEDYFAWAAPELQAAQVKLAKLEAERGVLQANIPEVVVTQATTPRETRILPRGDFLNEAGAVVEPAIPTFLGKLDTGGRRATRLDLANWLVSPSNPLTARVYVNRLWRQFFGMGLSKVLEDLGSQGEWPTHLELLDWMAAEFMHPEYKASGTHDWDAKHMIRLIVLSQTYRQSSVSTLQLDERDPDNRLLAHQSRFRVDAEVVHDVALSVSGLLVEKFGGPSVNPYEPAGYLAGLNFPKREYSASHGADLYRRGLYTKWQRTFLHPSLFAFDAPTREECTVNRTISNTPLQALVLLNDPLYVEASRVFAENILKEGGTNFNQRLTWAFERAVDRAPTEQERQILATLYRANLSRFRKAPENAKQLVTVGEAPLPEKTKPVDLAAMTTVARAILNMHETITRN
jgi:hypothetical protein